MASSQACNKKKRIKLTENDVLEASFKDKEPELFHNDQLRRWCFNKRKPKPTAAEVSAKL